MTKIQQLNIIKTLKSFPAEIIIRYKSQIHSSTLNRQQSSKIYQCNMNFNLIVDNLKSFNSRYIDSKNKMMILNFKMLQMN
jgi:4-hydroxy-3-methylbut-2-enyl diphosphate reductase IspH